MTTGADVRDILELAGGENDAGPINKKDILNSDKVSQTTRPVYVMLSVDNLALCALIIYMVMFLYFC